MVISTCGNDLSFYVKTPFLYVGTSYNITPYTLEQSSIVCDGLNSTGTLTVKKNGIIIGTQVFQAGQTTPVSFDNGNICVDMIWFDCNSTNANIQYDVWYNPESLHIDLHIKPNTWYSPQSAYTELSSKAVELSGQVANAFSSISGYQYIGTTILPPDTDGTVIVRVEVQTASPQSTRAYIAPAVAAAVITLVAYIVVVIGIGVIVYYTVSSVKTTFEGKDILQNSKNILDRGKVECQKSYPNRATDKTEAIAYNNCLKSLILATGVATGDFFNDTSYNQNAQNTANQIDTINAGLQNGTITPGESENQTNQLYTKLDEYYQKKIDEMNNVLNGIYAIAVLVGLGAVVVYGPQVIKAVQAKTDEWNHAISKNKHPKSV